MKAPKFRILAAQAGLFFLGAGQVLAQDEGALVGSWDRIPVHQVRPRDQMMEVLYLQRPCPYAAVPYSQTMHLVLSRTRGIGCWKPAGNDLYMTVFADGAYQLSQQTLTDTFQLAIFHPQSDTFTIIQKDGAGGPQ